MRVALLHLELCGRPQDKNIAVLEQAGWCRNNFPLCP